VTEAAPARPGGVAAPRGGRPIPARFGRRYPVRGHAVGSAISMPRIRRKFSPIDRRVFEASYPTGGGRSRRCRAEEGSIVGAQYYDAMLAKRERLRRKSQRGRPAARRRAEK